MRCYNTSACSYSSSTCSTTLPTPAMLTWERKGMFSDHCQAGMDQSTVFFLFLYSAVDICEKARPRFSSAVPSPYRVLSLWRAVSHEPVTEEQASKDE